MAWNTNPGDDGGWETGAAVKNDHAWGAEDGSKADDGWNTDAGNDHGGNVSKHEDGLPLDETHNKCHK